MYAGEAERQLSALAQTNAALANEQYNRKMAALQQAEFFTKIGDKRRGEAIKDATRSGILGMGANVIDALRGNNGNPNVQMTNSQMQGQAQGQQMQSPTDKPLLDAIKGFSKTDVAQSNRFNKQDDINKAYMVANMEHQKATGQMLDPMDFKKMYQDRISLNPNVAKDATLGEDLNLGSVDYDSSNYRKDLQDKSNQISSMAGDQKVIDAENKTIASDNKKIEAENLKAQKEYERKVQKDPIGGFLNYAKEKGIVIPTEFTGDKAEQRKQNYDLHNAQIEYFMDNKMYNKARKAENEWIQNEINIDKSWGDKGDGNYKSLWNTSGPSKEKTQNVGVAITYTEGGDRQPATNYDIPVSKLKSRSETVKYILEQENKGRKEAGLPLMTINDIQITKPVTGDGSLTEDLEYYNDGVDKYAMANGTTIVGEDGNEIVKMVRRGKDVFVNKNNGKKYDTADAAFLGK